MSSVTRTFVVTVFCALFSACLAFVGAKTVEAASPLVPNDTFWNREWYMRQIHAPEAWAMNTGASTVTVAVIDGGVDITHPDLRDNIWVNPDENPTDGKDNDNDGFVDDVHGWNFITDSPDVRPVYLPVQFEEAWSHGTLTASLLAAKGNDGTGMAGMAWNVKVMPLVVLDGNGSGTNEDMVKAIRYAIAHHADVINMSLVGYQNDSDLDAAIRDAAKANIVIVAATGNQDDDKNGLSLDVIPAYPVCDDYDINNYVIGVSGTDTLDQRAPYANYGKRCTDLSAPALQIFAARPSYPHDTKPTSTVPGYLDDVTGTSLAAPLVSGVAALLKSAHPDWTAAQIRDRIISTTDSIEGNLPENLKGQFGSGRLNAGRALGFVPDALPDVATGTVTFATSIRSSWVTSTNAGTGEKKTWQPFGATYRGGIQQVTLTDHSILLWPMTGGGHALVYDERGALQQNSFPFGKTTIGAWRLRSRADGSVSVTGPRNVTGKLIMRDGKLVRL